MNTTFSIEVAWPKLPLHKHVQHVCLVALYSLLLRVKWIVAEWDRLAQCTRVSCLSPRSAPPLRTTAVGLVEW